ncbi:hypothetical protein BDR26DRAFT_933317 [Obelidium mucronatum]|nr:hypothetical protein BDR26DRAFT_933317 [Obelidium mucronatum]
MKIPALKRAQHNCHDRQHPSLPLPPRTKKPRWHKLFDNPSSVKASRVPRPGRSAKQTMADHFMATNLDAETAKWTTIYLNKTGSHNQELENVPEDRLVRLVDETTGRVIALMNVIPLDLLDHIALAEYLRNAPITAKDCSNLSKHLGIWKRYCKFLFATKDLYNLTTADVPSSLKYDQDAAIKSLDGITEYMTEFYRAYLPGLYDFYARIRRKLKEYKEVVVKDPSSVEAKTKLASALLSQLDDKFLNVFSTCAVSYNSPRAAKSHRDLNNYAYAMDACIPFGPFSGGGTIEGDRFAVILFADKWATDFLFNPKKKKGEKNRTFRGNLSFPLEEMGLRMKFKLPE